MGLSTVDILIRSMIAVIVGGIIGYERERQNHQAGLRTHILVCLGAAVVSMVQLEMANQAITQVLANANLAEVIKVDIGRLTAQVVTGIGFLGTGTILRSRQRVRGLTTAATLWIAGCIGIGAGMGYYVITAVATLMVIIALRPLKILQDHLIKLSSKRTLTVVCTNSSLAIAAVNELLTPDIQLKNIDFEDSEESGEGSRMRTVIFHFIIEKSFDMAGFKTSLYDCESVLSVHEP